MLRELGDLDGALRDLDYAAVLDPSHVDTLVNRADLLMELGEGERAQADVEAGLALDPKNANLLSARGALLEDAGDAEAAFASYTAALEADPEFVAAWVNRAVLAFTQGNPEAAVEGLDRAIALSDDPALRANRALALHELGEHERALADLDIAVPVLGEEDPDLFFRRGATRHALGDIEGARADWARHLDAYRSAGEPSPFADEIRSHGPVPVGAAGTPGNAE
jgi:tetratricopeptide (TPR) repeat protein